MNILEKTLAKFGRVLISISESIKTKQPTEKNNYGWSGNYTTWEEAQKQCSSYAAENILEKVKTSLLKVKKGEAVYERDSVLLPNIEYSWALLAGLLKVAAENKGTLTVIDYGGSLGSTFFQNRFFLNGLTQLLWLVVEQPHFVKTGKEYFEDEQLKFFSSAEEAVTFHKPDIMLLSSVIQYLPNAENFIHEILKLELPYIIFDRTAFINDTNERITIQRVPPEIYEASYPTRFFNFDKLISYFSDTYEMITAFDSFCDSPKVTEDNKKLFWKGIILKHK